MDYFKEKVYQALKTNSRVKIDISQIEIPPDSKLGDFAFPCFSLSKEMKKNPKEIASDLAKKIKSDKIIDRVEANNAYLNFYLNKSELIKHVLTEKEKHEKKKEKVMIEYSAPNTHKDFHIGHLRNVSIGSSLVNLMRDQGYEVVSANYINDTGAHVAKCLWGYLKFHKGKEPKHDKGKWLGQVYFEANKKLSENPDLKKEVDEILKKLELKDKEIIKLWNETRKWSLDSFNEIYKSLNVEFDAWFYDHELIEPAKKIVDNMKSKGIIEESDGALIADLEKYNLHKLIIRKSDGTTPYITKDFELAARKFDEYKIDTSIYVVGVEQSTHFKQLFKILELYGFKQAKKCYHVAYELVMLKEGKMGSREGNAVLYFDFYNEMKKKALIEVKKKREDLNEKEKEDIAEKVTISAMKFGMLNQENNKAIQFDMNKSLDFEGETGPYVQYTYARISSILRKSKSDFLKANLSLLKDEEYDLVKIIYKFPLLLDEVSQNFKVSLLAKYLLTLSQSFNNYYHSTKVIQENKELEKARLHLISRVKDVLSKGLGLLGIDVMEMM